MSHLTVSPRGDWAEESSVAESAFNGWEEELGSEGDVVDGRQTFRANYSAMEAEIRRLTAEVRALKESKIDQEATQLAMEHGFLSPFGAKLPGRLLASTPVSNKHSSRASPNVLNASAILDDDANFSFEDWSSPVKDSPTSRLLRTPFRPKPYFISTVSSTQPPSSMAPRFPESLVPDPDLAASTPAPKSPISGLDAMTPAAVPLPSSIHPSTPQSGASIMRTPMRAIPVTPKNGPFAYEEPQARVLTRVVYIPRSSHWCEHICQILFILLVITISIAVGIILAESGGLEALQGPPPIYPS